MKVTIELNNDDIMDACKTKLHSMGYEVVEHKLVTDKNVVIYEASAEQKQVHVGE